MSEGVVCLELVREFFANIHASDEEGGTLKSYVRGMYLDFSIFDICTFHHIQPLDLDIVGFPYPPSMNGPSLNSLAHLLANEGDWPLGPSSLLKQKDCNEPDETRIPVGKAISRHTLRMSNAHLGVAPPPQLCPHVLDLDPSDDKTPPAAPDVPSTSATPPATDLAAASNSRIAMPLLLFSRT
ncbi:hypothetical protein Acr_00g0099410 [Actinidia rufa]|uniref:Uncharacterized protein n=1 Tax=Actinidia rufa TaxID=165716 RepID=A0A7J0E0M7_9ERIC|nr:hypothetical protein Acr_00g0099410 [Actinidia rufa]